jgi:hypothetical protein
MVNKKYIFLFDNCKYILNAYTTPGIQLIIWNDKIINIFLASIQVNSHCISVYFAVYYEYCLNSML